MTLASRDSTFAVWLVLWGFFSINEYFPNGHARPAPRDRNISRRAACNFPKTVCDDLAVRKKGGFTRARIGRVVVLHKQASKLSHRQAIVCGAFFTSCRRSSGIQVIRSYINPVFGTRHDPIVDFGACSGTHFIDACKRTVSGSLHDFIDSP